jgi:hypothetical protein
MTEESNRTLFVLTSVTVLALPINIMAGPFGMNVGGHTLWSKRPWILVGGVDCGRCNGNGGVVYLSSPQRQLDRVQSQ